MPIHPSLAIIGLGMVTPVGDDVSSSCAALRAGISGVALQRQFSLSGNDPDWDPREPMRMGRVLAVPPALEGSRRLHALALKALDEAIRSAKIGRRDWADTALLVALPSGDTAVDGWGLDTFAEELVGRAGLQGVAMIETARSGHVAALELCARASEILSERRAARAIVLTADSHWSAERVAALDAGGRLRSRRSPDGFTPGEAAIGLVLTLEKGPRALARVRGFGRGTEPHSLHSDRAPTGRGLETAVREALRGSNEEAAIEWLLCDLNGESYRAADWGAFLTRLAGKVAPNAEVAHPAELVGDVGCASGGLSLALAAVALQSGYAPSKKAIATAASEAGDRASIVIESAD